MTAVSNTSPSVPTANPADGGRNTRAARAQDQAPRPSEEPGFEAALAMAARLGLVQTGSPIGGLTGTTRSGAASATKAGVASSVKADDQFGPSRSITSAAAHALTQSQADRLRTIGPGVSLSALAQAELAGQGGGKAPSAGGTDSQSPARADVVSPASARAGQGNAHRDMRPTAPGVSATHPSSAANQHSGPASSPAAGPAPALATLERFSSASSRATAIRPGSGSRHAPAIQSPAGLAGYSGLISRGTGLAAQAAGPSGLTPVPPTSAATGQLDGRAPRAARAVSPPPAPPREQFLAQVHRALGQALRAKDGPVTLHLTPGHLGQLRVDLTRTDQGVAARFDAATPEAHRLLESSLTDLRAALEARGLHVDRLDVRLVEARSADAERHADDPSRDPPASADDPRQWGGGAHPNQQRSAPQGDDGVRPEQRRPGAAGDPGAAEPAPDGPALPDHSGLRLSTIELVA